MIPILETIKQEYPNQENVINIPAKRKERKLVMISDEYCVHTGKHRDNFEYEDWYRYFIEHGATPDLAKKMAENKRPMVQFVSVSKDDFYGGE